MVSKSILIVEDDETTARALARILGTKGYDATLAQSGTEAWAHALAARFRVIIVDFHLTDVDGLTLIDRLKAVQPDAVIMLLSSGLDVDLALAAVNEHGVGLIIQKPWKSNGDVVHLVERAFTTAAGRAQSGQRVRALETQAKDLERWAAHLEDVVGTQAQRLLEVVIEAWGQRHPALLSHGRRVARYGELLAEALGLDEAERLAFAEAAALHDLSMVCVPDQVLLKPGPLDQRELGVLRSHIDLGRRLLDRQGQKPTTSLVFAQHHEHWDGQGYPRGLAGEQICIGARLFAVAEAIDAITSERPYRPGKDIVAAKDEIQRCAGTQFDPAVVEAFVRIPPQRFAS